MTITNKILYKIHKQGRGWVFTPKDFLKIRHFNTINPLLDRLENRGEIRSFGKGVYDYPVYDKERQKFKPPKLDAVIRVVELQLNDKFQFSGEYAAFLFGLSKSMPAELKYLSNKHNKKTSVAGYNITIAKTLIPTPRNKYDKATLAVQALRYLGKTKATLKIVRSITQQLNEKELRKLNKLSTNIEWINSLLMNK